MPRIRSFGGDRLLSKMGVKFRRIEKYDAEYNSSNSAGVLCKMASTVNGKKTYIKTGKSNYPGFELNFPVAEVICQQLGTLMGIRMATYELWAVDADLFLSGDDLRMYLRQSSFREAHEVQKELISMGKVLVSASPSFTEDRFRLTHASSLHLGELQGRELYDALISSRRFKKDFLDRMIVFDYIVCNIDRHHNNFGYLTIINGIRGIIFPSPLYDNGDSLLSSYSIDFIKEFGMDASFRNELKPFYDLKGSLSWISKDSLVGINLDIKEEDIVSMVLKYLPILGDNRSDLMIKLISGRLKDVKRRLSLLGSD